MKPRWKEQAQPGAGVLWDLGSHLIDQALQLFGMPRSVTARLAVQRHSAQVEDAFALILDHGATTSHLHAARYQVHGTHASFVKSGIDPQETALKLGKRPSDPGWGRDAPDNWATITTADGVSRTVESLPGAYEAYYQGVYRAVTDGAQVPVRPEEALDVVRVIELALRSHRERRTMNATAAGGAGPGHPDGITLLAP